MRRLTAVKLVWAAILLFGLPLIANAQNENTQNENTDFNYNYLEGGFVSIDSGTGNPSGTIGSLSGLGIDGSYEIAPQFRLVAGMNTTSCCDYRLNNFNIGIGYHQMLLRRLGLFVTAQLVNSNGKYSPPGFSASSSDTGFGLVGGVRFIPVEKVEVDGFVSVTGGNNFVDSSPSPGVFGMYNFAPHWNVFASYTANADMFYTGVRYDF